MFRIRARAGATSELEPLPFFILNDANWVDTCYSEIGSIYIWVYMYVLDLHKNLQLHSYLHSILPLAVIKSGSLKNTPHI
jgi:hypothetical protein